MSTAGTCDDQFLDSIGLGQISMMSTLGNVCAENLATVLSTLDPSNSSVNAATKAFMAQQLKTWIFIVQPDQKSTHFNPKIPEVLDLVGKLAVSTDDSVLNESGEYSGNVLIAVCLTELLSNYIMMDVSGELARAHAAHAYRVLEAILVASESNSAIVFTTRPMNRSRDNAGDCRSQLCSHLLKIMPVMGSVDIPNGLKVISKILVPKNKFPMILCNDARSTMNVMTMNCKDNLARSGNDLMEIVKAGGNDQLLMSFVSMPELYKNTPEAVHNNLAIFMKQMYMQYCSLYNNVAQNKPEVLVPHLKYFLNQLSSQTMVGTVTLMILENIAKVDPELLYPEVKFLVEKTKSVQNGTGSLAKVLANIGKANSKAADEIIVLLVDLLESSSNDQLAAPSLLFAISNTMKFISDKELLTAQMPRITKFKSASEVLYTSISDFAAGRSLETLTNRVDALEAKINAMNLKISETCTNMADVIAYVDANMADMKDFLAEVVKKLPNPKRLEVVGTLRKTLILHFECCRTGLEYPIVSHDWSKWLKIGFSLIKAGKAVIDIGMGNPLGLLSTGITCVQEVYQAYQTNDDDEFNTYITQPFLTSAEQDVLINKLRDQGFFDIFAYDAQLGGWYLLNPEKDGREPEGEANSVTKVRSKKGYGGVAEAIVEVGTSVAMGVMGGSSRADIADTVLSGSNSVTFSNGETSPLHKESSKSKDVELQSSPSKGSSSTYVSGGRAQAMKDKMNPTTVALAEASVGEATRQAQYYQKVDDYEKRIQQLEAKVSNLQNSVDALNANKSSCNCVIS